MATTVGDFLLKRLAAWGVRRVYGYPGDGINGIMGAFGRDSGNVEFVQARHEELAAFMACAHAKFNGDVGVCLATSGPGAIHLLNGLYDAKADHQGVVAIVGQQKRAAMGGDYQQEVDLISLFKDVAHEYVHMVSTPAQVRHLVDRAMRIARDYRTVTCIIFPNGVQDMEAVETLQGADRAGRRARSGASRAGPCYGCERRRACTRSVGSAGRYPKVTYRRPAPDDRARWRATRRHACSTPATGMRTSRSRFTSRIASRRARIE